MNQNLRRLLCAFVLLLIVAGGAAIRYSGNGWDGYHGLHPDERFLSMVTSSLKWPVSFSEYLDEQKSGLNPRNHGHPFFAYGALPVTIVRGVTLWTGHNELERITAAGRAMSATFDLGSIVWVYLIAMQLYRDRRIGLAAAFLYAFAVLPIQQAHFYVADPALNFFLGGAAYFLARYQSSTRALDIALTGAFAGLATACKITGVCFVPVVFLVVLLKVERRIGRLTFHFLLAGMTGALLFRIAEPYAFGTPQIWNPSFAGRWLQNLAESSRLASGAADTPPGLQWAGRTPLVFAWINLVVWGWGLVAGIAAWVGWTAAGIETIRRRRLEHVIPVAWVALLFLYQGTRWNPTMRYFLPIYGALSVLAAWMLVRWSTRAPGSESRWWTTPRVAWSVSAVVLGSTLVWALAFTNIYRAPHTRVVASDWLYRNVPRGSGIASEHWDDGLPLRMYGLDPYGGMYHGVQMRWYDGETPKKRDDALEWLDQADWVVLSSNRLWASIPRVPTRYPLASRYYRALFDGSLGFEKVGEFTSFPRLGPVTISTRTAEEAFTVYDHPVVMIFRKTPRYSRANSTAIFADVRWGEVVQAPAAHVLKAPTGLMLPPDRLRAEEGGGSWKTIFPIAWAAEWMPAAVVLIFVYVVALGTAPLLFMTCRGLPDRGFGMSKAAGLLLASWLAWLAASTGSLHFERPVIWATAAAIFVAGIITAARNRDEIVSFVRSRWVLLAAIEVVFLMSFIYMALLRRSNPDLWHPFFGGEKPMDLAYFTAAIRSLGFPLYSPWYSGGLVNYYYFGFVPAAYICKAVAVPPEVGYNVMIAVLYAITASGIFTITYSLVSFKSALEERWRMMFAGAGVVLALCIGNLKQIHLYINALATLSAGGRTETLDSWSWIVAAIRGLAVSAQRDWDTGLGGWTWFFDASRAFNHERGEPVPVTEFPLFTFSFGDLHAHLMALPFVVLLIGLAVAISKHRPEDRLSFAALLSMTALTLGALPAANSWDTVAGAAIVAAVIWLSVRGRLQVLHAGLIWAAVVTGAWLLYLPFHRWFAPSYGAFELWRGSRTRVIPFLMVHGVFLAVIAPAALGAAKLHWTVLLPGAIVVAAGIWTGQGASTIAVCTLMIVLYVFWRERHGAAMRLVSLLLAACGLTLAIAAEWIVLRGDVGRMNTVFKFSFQAWILLAIGAAAMLSWIRDQWAEWSYPYRTCWKVGMVSLLAGSLIYPLTAPGFRARDRVDRTLGPGWDGMAFMRQGAFRQCGSEMRFAEDLGVIQWLRANVTGKPAIAEFNTFPQLYGWGNRISNFTGLPAIVGWDWHLRQQMGWFESGRVKRRIDDIKSIYGDGGAEETWLLLKKYEARYVIWGALERACAAAAGPKFERGLARFWDVAYDHDGARVYSVRTEPAETLSSESR